MMLCSYYRESHCGQKRIFLFGKFNENYLVKIDLISYEKVIINIL